MSSFSAIGVTPFHRPDARLALALARAGALGVLDLGTDRDRGLRELGRAASVLERDRSAAAADAPLAEAEPESSRLRLGVRLHPGASIAPKELPACVRSVLLVEGAADELARWTRWARPKKAMRRVLVEVRSLPEALAAAAAGVDG